MAMCGVEFIPQMSCLCLGNGVVIHLPGLFEEGDKNEKKGKAKSEPLKYFIFD